MAPSPCKCPLVLTKKGEQAGDAIAQKIATVLREIDATASPMSSARRSTKASPPVSDRLGAIARTGHRPTTASKKE